MREFGVLAAAVTVEDFCNRDAFIVMGAEPYRVDILMGPPGLEFDEAYSRRMLSKQGDISLSYFALDDLLTLKRAAKRPVDLRDVEMLEAGKRVADNEKKL